MPFEVHITRASNGWLVRFPADAALETTEQLHVFSDEDVPGLDQATVEACSLREALMEAFQDYMRSKHKAGISFDVRPSRTAEDAAREETPP
jgi:hypothetical protein